MIKETLEWRQGRLGEILQIALYMEYGLRLADLAGTTNNKAPLLHHRDLSLVAADGLAIKTGPAFIEFKTKSHHQEWNGGSPEDTVRVPPRIEEGIDQSKWTQYRATRQTTRMPFVLSILSIKEGELLCNTLDELGEPRKSPHPQYDLVNWDVRQFRRVARFDPERLAQFFRDLRADSWLADIPASRKLKEMIAWLQPRDMEFTFVLEHIFDQIEQAWHQ